MFISKKEELYEISEQIMVNNNRYHIYINLTYSRATSFWIASTRVCVCVYIYIYIYIYIYMPHMHVILVTVK